MTDTKQETLPKKHRFNNRFFCSECGADAIGLRGWPRGMECPFDKRAAIESSRCRAYAAVAIDPDSARLVIEAPPPAALSADEIAACLTEEATS